MAAASIKESVEHDVRRAEQAAIRASHSAPGPLLCGPSFLLIILGLVSGCQRAGSVSPGDDRSPVSARAEGQHLPWFVDITAESGLNFVHDAGPTGSYFVPQIIGSERKRERKRKEKEDASSFSSRH